MSSCVVRERADTGLAMDDPLVTCKGCGFEWFGSSAADALRTLGSCTRCRGELRFDPRSELPSLVEEVAADVPPHLALGNPRF